MPTSTEIANSLRTLLPDNHAQFADAYAIAALNNRALGIPPLQFALLHAGVIDRESKAGDFLKPRGAEGTGDPSPRFYPEIPKWAEELGLATGRVDDSGRYEIVPPAYAKAKVAGWGYGLGQIDFVYWRQWLDRAEWKNPFVNLNKSAEILANGIESLGDVRLGVAAYNAGIGRVRNSADNPDAVTTGKDYSADVIARAGSYGFDVVTV